MKVKYPLTEAVVFFTFNFPDYHEVIRWIALHQHTCSYSHLLTKWEQYAKNYSPAEAWLRFYVDLEDNIRKAMTDYIMEVFAPKCGNFNDDELQAMNASL